MEQSVGADDLSRRVAEDRELVVDNFLPDQTGVLTVIYTDCHNPRIQRIEVFFVPRELAQLTRAVRSPIAAIENKQDVLATLCSGRMFSFPPSGVVSVSCGAK